ncbi:MAG TPA: hypothetical protein VHB47_01020, partial [Thermoanaerobaculia bacterium]|nr:hypothetical protein [Thermoanaerobaculia bacterium]
LLSGRDRAHLRITAEIADQHDFVQHARFSSDSEWSTVPHGSGTAVPDRHRDIGDHCDDGLGWGGTTLPRSARERAASSEAEPIHVYQDGKAIAEYVCAW